MTPPYRLGTDPSTDSLTPNPPTDSYVHTYPQTDRERDQVERDGCLLSNAQEQKPLRIVPVSYQDACGFVSTWHRHHKAPRFHKFSIGAVTPDDTLVGVAMVSIPVARMLNDGLTLEVQRSATDGTPNANSALYGAAWRAAKALGYRRLITYTQAGESGSSLKGAGWRVVAERPAHAGWTRPSRPREDHGVDYIPRTLWEAM